MKEESIKFLHDNINIWERLKQGNPKHLSDQEAETFLSIAKEIDPKINFQIRECFDCVNSLVSYVFMALENPVAKMTFPKTKIKKDGSAIQS